MSQVGTLWSLLTAGCNLASSVSPLLTAYLTTTYGWSAAFTVPGFVAVILSCVLYLLICDRPSDIGLNEFSNNKTSTKTESEDYSNSHSNKVLFALLRSPFLWMLCTGYMLTLFLRAGVSDWTLLYLMQTKKKSQYDGKKNEYCLGVNGHTLPHRGLVNIHCYSRPLQ